ncbi:MAG: aminotransferase class III-fold pyridoxal phosphate-dependent enzyme [Actinobacteria bacterium]|nr:aminotransferase class III-fold pyridoxal phosphate-dependent enzyme [Actinomycetota bacterium]
MPDIPSVLTSAPPTLQPETAADLASRVFGIAGTLSPLGSERDQNFMVEDGSGDRYLLKLSNAAEDESGVTYETDALLHILRTDPGLPVMEPVTTTNGTYWASVDTPSGTGHLIRMFTFLEGTPAAAPDLDLEAIAAFGATLARLGRSLRGFFHPAAGRKLLWDERHASDLRPLLEHITDDAQAALTGAALDRFDARVLPVVGSLRAQTIHNDFSLDNTLMGPDRRVSGILDFGDLTHTALVCDLSTAMSSVMFGRDDPGEAGEAVVAGYASITPVEELELSLLPDLLAARLVALIAIAAWRVRSFPENREYIMGSVAEAHSLLAWLDGGGYADLEDRLGAGSSAAPTAVSTEELRERRRVLGSAMSPLSYQRPLHLVRGDGPWLYDTDGVRYLDAYNNVPVVGHCHPLVSDAIARQSRALNTNLRYLHENSIELAERLCGTLPDGLDVCMFVNSGSEANDLAWQLARAVTGRAGGIVTEYAYHGITTAVSDLSPEHWARGYTPDTVATIPAPDGHAGVHRREDPNWAAAYAAHLDDAVEHLRAGGLEPAALFLDSGFTSDGILVPPAEYGRDVVDRIHATGGLFVADEVQTGFGRLGAHLWGFERFGVTPDIVTLGKPMGNGHPVAAVLTTSAIVDRFAQTMDFFSTFGGNPVACAAGLAVLDVIESEGIQERVMGTGNALIDGLRVLAERHSSIGEVRGLGLLIGVAFTSDDTGRPSDAALAGRVMNGMRERGILIGTTGPDDNVLKIRPPLVITEEHVDLLLTTLDEVLRICNEPGGETPGSS